MRERAAGSAYVAAAESCAAWAAPAIARSRALTLGTTYPPASAAAGARKQRAAMRLRMFVVLYGATRGEGGAAPVVNQVARSVWMVCVNPCRFASVAPLLKPQSVRIACGIAPA